MQKLPLYLVSFLAVIVTGFAIYQHLEIRDQTLRISALEKTISARDTFVAETQQAAEKLAKQNKAFTDESAALRDKLAAKAKTETEVAAAPQISPTPESSSDKKNPFGGMMDKMMKNPKMLDAIAAQQMAVLKPMYSDLIKQLNLSPEETKQFFELLSAQTSKAMEAGMKMISGDKKAIDQIATSTDEIKTFLGERYSQYENYQKSIPDRAQLGQVSAQMAARQTPLRPDQSSGLLQIMQQEKLNTSKFTAANTDPNNTNFNEETINDTFQAQEDRNSRILARSKTLLTPEQWNALGEQQKQSLQMQKMGMEMAKGMFSQPKK